MWDDPKGESGANVMASGLLKWALFLNDNVSEITVWSNNCPSQREILLGVTFGYCISIQTWKLLTTSFRFGATRSWR